MQNQEVLKEYGTEKWVVEEVLCYLLQEYWEAVKENTKRTVPIRMPINPVSFIKEFMKEETLVNTEYAEKSKMDTTEKNVIVEIDGQEVVETAEIIGFDINNLSEQPEEAVEMSTIEVKTGGLNLVWPGEE